MRETYAASKGTKRYEAGRKVAEMESETEALETEILSAEKALRNNENK
ncbi:MAG: hypothetical protein LUC22_03395 [Prevotella sp.]|nr:hypothetical protein [Prevotella sp.]